MVGRESGLGGKNIKLKFMRVLETGGKGQEPGMYIYCKIPTIECTYIVKYPPLNVHIL
jgi:hypothetical protein